MTDIFHISKLLIKKRLKVLTKSEKLQLKKFNTKYPFSKEIKIEDLVDKIESYSKINKERAWKSIEVKTQKKIDKPVFQLFNTSWYKYAAAVIIILTTAYFLKDAVFKELDIDNQIIVDIKTIVPGTDKATLTLSDGSLVSLEKGKTVKTRNANSNGEKIIYKSTDKKPATVAYNYLTIPRGGHFFIELSDGTQVWLNSESQLKYPVAFVEGKTREVELVYGEAYFDVTPSTENEGSKFRVLNKSQEIEVLGTEFNIKAYKDEKNIYTTLVEGKVSVNSGATNQILKPKQQANLNLIDNSITIDNVNVYHEVSWKEGVFIFRRKSLEDIMKVLSRWYDIDVEFVNPELKKVGFNGTLGKDQNIEDILRIIKNFEIIKDFEIINKRVILK